MTSTVSVNHATLPRFLYRRSLMLCVVTHLVLPERAGAQSVIVGVLDEIQCETTRTRGVTPLFVRDAGVWMRVPDRAVAPRWPVEWTSLFAGRAVGAVRVQAAPRQQPVGRWYLPISGDAPVAPRGTESLYEGWCGQPATRPLIVVAHGQAADPDHWMPVVEEQKGAVADIFSQFERAAGKADRCASVDGDPRPFHYDASHLEAVLAFIDSRGRRALAYRLRPSLYVCDGPPGSAWSVFWFLQDSTVSVIGRDLMWLGSGDFDGDGSSEVVFWLSSYNRDGYVLFDSRFSRRVEYVWSYH